MSIFVPPPYLKALVDKIELHIEEYQAAYDSPISRERWASALRTSTIRSRRNRLERTIEECKITLEMLRVAYPVVNGVEEAMSPAWQAI